LAGSNSGPLSDGLDAAMRSDLTTPMLTPS
jgi:hypothetical protein